MTGDNRRRVCWRINTSPDEFEVVRRTARDVYLVGVYPRMDWARDAAEEDRRAVLADPMMVELSPLEVRVKRG